MSKKGHHQKPSVSRYKWVRRRGNNFRHGVENNRGISTAPNGERIRRPQTSKPRHGRIHGNPEYESEE